MEWYEMNGKKQDVIVSTRVRIARNLVDYPFDPKLDKVMSNEIIDKVKSVFDSPKYSFVDFNKLSANEKMSYVEKHIVSSEFANKSTPHALIENKDTQTYIMVCEEDHIRAQVILPGLALDECYEQISNVDKELDSKLNIAFNDNLGYLTHCPTNLGTAMRASVMMFLPAMTMNSEIGNLQYQLEKIGVTIRGMSGEGSKAYACLYQVSNQVTLGVSEEDILSKVKDVVEKISKRELELRSSIKDGELLKLKDNIYRSYGILKYATLLSSSEMLNLYSDVRLGISLNMFSDLSYSKVDKMLISTMPATIAALDKKYAINAMERDAKRAEIVKALI